MTHENLYTTNLLPVRGLCGLVACGGNSSRMGTDKSMLVYHQKPQRYHLYEMVQPICEMVLISCNKRQASNMEEGYQVMVDMEPFHNTGPMGALLTAFTQYPGYDVLLIGCDYPFLTAADLYSFLPACKEKASAAFYNANEDIYEPLLAYYQHNSMKELSEAYSKGHYSLQRFLRNTYATKFDPQNKRSMIGVNTKEGFLEASGTINYRKDENFAG